MNSQIAGQQDLLEFVVSRFQAGNVRFLLTGSLAVSYYGYPRATHDIDKVDLWLEQSMDFARKWSRRQMMVLGGQQIALISPEDLILTKLIWCKEVWSDRHFRDCVGMWQIQKGKLDEAYCARWVKRFGLEGVWKNMTTATY